MKGVIGCDALLKPGDVVQTGPTTMIVIHQITEQEARESAKRLGMGELVVAPGELFYAVETQLAPTENN